MQGFSDKSGKPIPGPFRIVRSPAEFAELTLQGWGLIFSYQESVPDLVLKFAPSPHRGDNRGRWVIGPDGQQITVPCGHEETYEQVIVTRQWFVLQRGTEPALADATEKALAAEERCHEAEMCQGESALELGKLRDALRAAEERAHADGSAYRLANEARLRCAESLQKMERAIALLRKEIGEAKMREILGE